MTRQLQAGAEALITPMSAPERIRRIAQLHQESKKLLQDTTRILITNAIEAGELLQQQKDILPHGTFTVWLQHNKPMLGFGERQAQRYMKIARHKDELIVGQASSMEEALALLSPSHRTDKKEQKEKSGILQSNTDRTPNLPTETDTRVGFNSPDSMVKNDTCVGFDGEFSPRDKREITAMVAELGIPEKDAQQIVAWRKSKQKKKKSPAKNAVNALERSTYRLPSPIRRRVQSEAKVQGVSESEILRKILNLYYPDRET